MWKKSCKCVILTTRVAGMCISFCLPIFLSFSFEIVSYLTFFCFVSFCCCCCYYWCYSCNFCCCLASLKSFSPRLARPAAMSSDCEQLFICFQGIGETRLAVLLSASLLLSLCYTCIRHLFSFWFGLIWLSGLSVVLIGFNNKKT